MTLQLSPDEKVVFDAVKYLPAISIMMPFEPKLSSKNELEYRMKMAMSKVESELSDTYPAEKTRPLINRLHQLAGNLNYNTHKKSIAIFLSPMVEKVFYLDIRVEEKMVIDETFEIRDLVYNKKQTIQYLLLLLSADLSTMYLGDSSGLLLIKSNHASQLTEKDMPEKVANFTDAESKKEISLNRFLHQMDQGLSIILKAYPLPVFVLGAEKVLGYFKKQTVHEKSIVQYVHGNYNEAKEDDIRKVIEPYIQNWRQVRDLDLLHQLESARDVKKLAYGINEVWHTAEHQNCRLLVVEKDFMYPARKADEPGIIYPENEFSGNPFYIKDAVDDVMQKVLENGGDVEFVDNGVLGEYGRIALIQYF
jgi:hypothetical protein